MAISDRTRKMLWGRAAGRCALCNRPLVLNPSDAGDREAVLGDECHIVAQGHGGPRAEGQAPSGLDDYDNLILLCKVDHKQVDDQPAHFTPERLRQLKADHERRFAQRADWPPDIRFVDDPTAGKAALRRVQSGRELWDVTAGSHSWSFGHPDPADEAEAELLARVMDNITDWSEIAGDLGPGEAVRGAFALGQDLDDLAEHGLVVYATRHRRLMTGGGGASLPWLETILRIVRTSDVGAGTET